MPFTPSASLNSTRALGRIRRLGLLDALDQVYAVLPETRCRGCGQCCFQSPGLFYVEYLAALERLSCLPAEQQEARVRAAFRELFFAWIEPDRSCTFLDERRCRIYEHRPLACRLFGLTSPADLEQVQEEFRLAAEEEAYRLSRRGIEVPRATLTRALAGCRHVRSVSGRRPVFDQDELAERVARLDEHLLSREVVIREYCFQSLPDRLGAAVFGEEKIEGLRLRLVRRAQRGEAVEELLAPVMKRAKAQAVLIHTRRRR